MIAFVDALRTAHRLGLNNISRVVAYRTAIRTGVYRQLSPIGKPISGPFVAFTASPTGSPGTSVDPYWKNEAAAVLSGRLRLFSSLRRDCGFPPHWNVNAITGASTISEGLHWTEIDPLRRVGDDIKGYWEPSRFDGLLALTLGWIASQDAQLASAWNSWLADWSLHNPANAGVNWVCGQETALRLLQTLLCAELIEMHSDSQVLSSLEAFAAEHCRRIKLTMLYATAQDNNHGTSEAAALYVGEAGSTVAVIKHEKDAEWNLAGVHSNGWWRA